MKDTIDKILAAFYVVMLRVILMPNAALLHVATH